MIDKDSLYTDDYDEKDIKHDDIPEKMGEHSWHRIKRELEGELAYQLNNICFKSSKKLTIKQR
ncbi:hypothetical protein HERIO_2589 [Hepatospora eriocheir]|uniref:Uncharacterized protein n=1 Tax=Hepatospora eriocheir TaxID=1081669 RepID=A0A1X0Q6A7_9MICR|nr:hypothetical protein HERIO_2589 [Hepatospora eriocheir]